jgi:hypothetical protein
MNVRNAYVPGESFVVDVNHVLMKTSPDRLPTAVLPGKYAKAAAPSFGLEQMENSIVAVFELPRSVKVMLAMDAQNPSAARAAACSEALNGEKLLMFSPETEYPTMEV